MIQDILAVLTTNILLTSIYVLPHPNATIVGTSVSATLIYKLKKFHTVTGLMAVISNLDSNCS